MNNNFLTGQVAGLLTSLAIVIFAATEIRAAVTSARLRTDWLIAVITVGVIALILRVVQLLQTV